jgi:superfamily I DNA/RNA helicase
MPTELTPTAEQQAVLTAQLTGESICITAVAGAGKTSTLRMIAQQIRDHGKRRPDCQPKKVLYVAYNKKAQLEAEASFGNLAECRTVHSLAYQWLRDQPFGRSFIAKLNGQRRTSSQDAYELGIHGDHLGLDPAEVAGLATATVGRFQNSDSQTIEPWMVPTVEGLDDGDMEQLRDVIVGYARDVWRNYMDPRGKLKPQHDTYVKMWARKKPILDWDVILYDEAQDADPCAAGVMELNASIAGKQVIAVGDSSQAIYGWRGAVDFLDTFKTTHRLSLTQSWRFGQTVADEANVWLGVIGAPDSVVGNPGRSSSLEELDDANADAVLCRTNAGTIENLISAHEAGRKVHLVGDGKEMLSFARAAERLQKGQRVRHPDLMAFRSWDQVLEYVEKDKGGADLKLFVRMVEQYGCQGVISAIDQALPEKEYMERRKRGERVLVVSTAHKSKGLEWDKVRIGGDFKLPTDKETGKPRPIPRTDAMLAYVAITRCRVSLDAGPLGGIHAHLAGLAQTVTP